MKITANPIMKIMANFKIKNYIKKYIFNERRLNFIL
jgi:hypothetical protein